jgi:hypothetical protein
MVEHIEPELILLKQGTYWRPRVEFAVDGVCLDTDNEGRPPYVIKTSTMLLLQSIRDVDHQAHTIILRAHPADYGRKVLIRKPSNHGSNAVSWYYENLSEFRFLTADFIAKFEQVATPEPIRAKELEAAQEHIQRLQRHLLEGQTTPEIIQPVLESGIKAWEKEKGFTEEQAHEVATTNPSMALVPTLTEGNIENFKLRVEREHTLATIRANWIKEHVEEIGEAVKALMPYFEEQAAAALSVTEDVIRKVGNIQKGIESLDLYIGKDVEVETVHKGASAPAGLPLTIAQRKLFMNEEYSVWADVTDEFDYHDDKRFLKDLAENQSLRGQIFPSERAIVCMATRRTKKEYGDPFINAGKNRINREVFLLVRDGENIHRVFSPVESHLAADQLFPSKSEADGIFQGADGSNIDYANVHYTDKLEKHENLALHYKRFLVLLAGLDHRLDLFGPFYEGPKTTKFVSMQFQKEHFRFIHDASGEGMLPQAERLSLNDWIKAQNTGLRSGSRVMCNFRTLANPDTAPGMTKGNDKRDGYYFSRTMVEATGVRIASESNGEIVVYCDTKSDNWNSSDKVLKSRVSITKFRPNAWTSGFGYLVLDSINADELDWYIHDRDLREDFLQYIRLFKSAIAYLREQEKREVPIRCSLRTALEDGKIGDPVKHDEMINQAIQIWRADHRGADAPPPSDTKSWTTLLDTMYTISAGPALIRLARKAVAEQGYEGDLPLRFVVTGANKLVLYVTPKADERDDRYTPHVWVRKFLLDYRKNDDLKVTRKGWAVLPAAAASETTLFEWVEDAAPWAGLISPFKSFEAKQDFIAMAIDPKHLDSPWLKQTVTPEEWEGMFTEWENAEHRVNEHASKVQHTRWQIPVGLTVHTEKNYARLLVLRSDTPVNRLWALATADEHRNRLMLRYISRYRYKDTGLEYFKREREDRGLQMFTTTEPAMWSEAEYSAVHFLNDRKTGSEWLGDKTSLDERFARHQAYMGHYDARYHSVPNQVVIGSKEFLDHFDDQRVKEQFKFSYLSPEIEKRGGLDAVFKVWVGEFETGSEE